jgi:DNA-binding transcriptional MocR family regulator
MVAGELVKLLPLWCNPPHFKKLPAVSELAALQMRTGADPGCVALGYASLSVAKIRRGIETLGALIATWAKAR